MSDVRRITALIKKEQIAYVDLRFTDTRGKEQHVTLPAHAVDRSLFEEGKAFDGSSIAGWKSIEASDMVLRPDPSTALIDPFYTHKTLVLRCDVVDPQTGAGYSHDPRSIAKRAEAYLRTSGIAEQASFGPEPEFFIFDDVRFESGINHCAYSVDSVEGAWNTARPYEGGNLGYRPSVKGGYFPVPPVDSSQDIRSRICQVLADCGQAVEAHHHEVATGNQNEIATRFSTLVDKADQLQVFKYVVHNVAVSVGKTATFMPKPLAGDNGSGMHVHLSLSANGENLFQGDQVGGLSEMALHFMGGVIHHAKALCAFTNASTNSYKRLVPGFEAPVLLAYSACNRSVALRIPHVSDPKARRFEVRFPDCTANPYLAFSALLMAGLDGIAKRLDPGAPLNEDAYTLDEKTRQAYPVVAASLDEALDALTGDRGFLCQGGVFSAEFIDSYIALKRQEAGRVAAAPHPVEFDLYYDL